MNHMAEDLLRQVPYHNAHRSLLPQAVPKLKLMSIDIPQPTPVKQHLQAWINECDQLQETVELRRQKTAKFDAWYAETCLSKRPPGMTTGGVLSPSRRGQKDTQQ
ncbi:LAME_0C01596g1_1 [Lachancea meyersii CBS 8951]|uniref:LAME_0C01596g1_1 n=1 Tax=Lachancea meyersii CBS 8951 TaxID=1266667 RepID=A0A1G4IZ27_9SACH|nr:LAME_0C01596g1_1 [Lachancea meyersii CBS 8951]